MHVCECVCIAVRKNRDIALNRRACAQIAPNGCPTIVRKYILVRAIIIYYIYTAFMNERRVDSERERDRFIAKRGEICGSRALTMPITRGVISCAGWYAIGTSEIAGQWSDRSPVNLHEICAWCTLAPRILFPPRRAFLQFVQPTATKTLVFSSLYRATSIIFPRTYRRAPRIYIHVSIRTYERSYQRTQVHK